MNMNQMIRLAMRLFRPLINHGIAKGVGYAAQRGKPAAAMTPAERKQAQQAKQTTRRARQIARLGRRLGR